jgi:hypothetical protein
MTGKIMLQYPIKSKKVRAGFQPHWRTIFLYICPECAKEVGVYACAFSGKTPIPGIGAIYCPKCPDQSDAKQERS